MTWSTREIAELAGTTVNTVRHYHRLGLLVEPERGGNGYKRYGVRDLVRLLRIRRLAELGVPLSQIEDVGTDCHRARDALRELSAELDATMERLRTTRDAVRAILREEAPADAPAGFESVASQLSEADSSIIHIYRRLYDDAATADLRRMVEVDAETGAVGAEFTALAADADDASRQRLAERLAPTLARILVEYPWLIDPAEHLCASERVTRHTFLEAVVELYNPAQLDVLARAGALATESVPDERAGHRPGGLVGEAAA